MLNHDTPGIKCQVIFLKNCQILLSIRLNMLTKQNKNLTLDQGRRLMSVRLFHNERPIYSCILRNLTYEWKSGRR